MKNQHIIVGMSGGVDSSVAALLLKEQGYHVEGLFMKNWEEDDTDSYCAAAQDVEDAQAVCDMLGIKLHRVNFAAEYWDHVFEYFLEEYRAGRTPNPDILCNKEIKFKAFLNYAKSLGADAIATGHYARNRSFQGQYQLLTGLDENKDQSYFLYALNQSQVAQALFPIGEHKKPEIRQRAAEAGFPNHAKKDSTGICFIGERRFKTFLETYLPAQHGNIETDTGKVVGKHDGLMFYTIGQRKGIGIGGRQDASESPWYVLDKDLKRNVLIIGQGSSHPMLLKPMLKAKQLTWIADRPPEFDREYTAKIRYRQTAQACHIRTIDDDTLEITFKTPQRAVTPGQSVVFYERDICLGGGVID
ncbi:MAG: tRNA 2-thiouridine(34) synthase MnmA [Gammaproteobacteria bacterium]